MLTRDLATYAIMKEVEAGRGSPAGGAYFRFNHVPEAELRRAFGPVIDTLAANGIDLAQRPIEVAPIAHYHMGGVRVDTRFETMVPQLFACGEAVGGANGANRLSGNAISEAWCSARAPGAPPRRRRDGKARFTQRAAAPALDLLLRRTGSAALESGGADRFASGGNDGQGRAIPHPGQARRGDRDDSTAMTNAIGSDPMSDGAPFDSVLVDWLDLRNMLLVAHSVAVAARARRKPRQPPARGFPGPRPALALNHILHWRWRLELSTKPVEHHSRRVAEVVA